MSFKTFAEQKVPLTWRPPADPNRRPFDITKDLKPGMRIRCLNAPQYVGTFLRYGTGYNGLQYWGRWDNEPGVELHSTNVERI